MSNETTVQSFKITREMIEGYCKNGSTVEEMATDITTRSGFKCTPAKVREAATHYGVDLRKKAKKSPFVFDIEGFPEATEEPQKGFRV